MSLLLSPRAQLLRRICVIASGLWWTRASWRRRGIWKNGNGENIGCWSWKLGLPYCSKKHEAFREIESRQCYLTCQMSQMQTRGSRSMQSTLDLMACFLFDPSWSKVETKFKNVLFLSNKSFPSNSNSSNCSSNFPSTSHSKSIPYENSSVKVDFKIELDSLNSDNSFALALPWKSSKYHMQLFVRSGPKPSFESFHIGCMLSESDKVTNCSPGYQYT